MESGPQRGGNVEDPTPLAARFHRPPMIVLAHPIHCIIGRYTAHDGQHRQHRSSAADATAAGDLDPLQCRPLVCFAEGVHSFRGGVRQSEIAPTHPAIRPVRETRVTTRQIDPELRVKPASGRPAQASASNTATVRELNNPFARAPSAHIPSLTLLRAVSPSEVRSATAVVAIVQNPQKQAEFLRHCRIPSCA